MYSKTHPKHSNACGTNFTITKQCRFVNSIFIAITLLYYILFKWTVSRGIDSPSANSWVICYWCSIWWRSGLSKAETDAYKPHFISENECQLSYAGIASNKCCPQYQCNITFIPFIRLFFLLQLPRGWNTIALALALKSRNGRKNKRGKHFFTILFDESYICKPDEC